VRTDPTSGGFFNGTFYRSRRAHRMLQSSRQTRPGLGERGLMTGAGQGRRTPPTTEVRDSGSRKIGSNGGTWPAAAAYAKSGPIPQDITRTRLRGPSATKNGVSVTGFRCRYRDRSKYPSTEHPVHLEPKDSRVFCCCCCYFGCNYSTTGSIFLVNLCFCFVAFCVSTTTV